MREGKSSRVSIWTLAYGLAPMVLAIVSSRPLVDNSFLWHVRAGDIQRRTGSVITADPFSFIALDEAWRTQSWLVDIGYSWVVDNGGLTSAMFIPLVAGSILFAVLAVLVRSEAPSGPVSAVLMASSLLVMLPFLQPRPVLFSYLGFVLLLLAYRHDALRWTVPLIIWAWAAVHGSFLLGLAIVGLRWLEVREKPRFVVGVVAFMAANLTAHGVMLWTVLIEFGAARPALDRITEWQPPAMLDTQFVPVTIGLLLVAGWLGRSRGLGTRGILLLPWVILGLSAVRSVPLLWLVLIPHLAVAGRVLEGRIRTSAQVRTGAAIAVVAVMGAIPLLARPADVLDPERFPLAAARHLSHERVFHDDVTGGYLVFAQWPERLVYIDDRAELYGQRLVDFADAKIGAPGWEETFERYDFGQALVRKQDAIASLLLLSDWEILFEDDVFVVLNSPEA